MDYKNIYYQIVQRGLNRKLMGYKETHHIIPRCMGGNNDKNNSVELTAREHFIAHQLLAKIYPYHKGLIFAAFSMNNYRKIYYSRNYEWIKIKLSESRTIHLDPEQLAIDVKTMNIKDIALKHNITPSTVSQRIKDYNIIREARIVDRSKMHEERIIIDLDWLQNELLTKNISTIANESEYPTELIRSKKTRHKLDNPQHYKKQNHPLKRETDPGVDLEWLQNELLSKSMPKIAKENNFDYEWLRYRVKKYELNTPFKRMTMDKIDIDILSKNILKYGITKTAEITGCSRDTVKEAISKYNLQYDKKFRKRKENEII